MNRLGTRRFALVTAPLALLLGLATPSCDSTSGSPGGGGGGGGGGSESPPVITSSPGAGEYSSSQSVSINSNESATIYYTTDGSVPEIDGFTTSSGSAPITGIQFTGPTGSETPHTLSFFGVDSAGLESDLKVDQYVIDRRPPSILQSGDPSSLSLLGSVSVTWQSDDDGAYTATVGGDGMPGSGTVLDSGTYSEQNVENLDLFTIDIPGSVLEPGLTELTLELFFADVAGNQVTAQWTVSFQPFVDVNLPAGTTELAFATTLDRVYVLNPSADQVLVIDTATNALVSIISVDTDPNGLALLPDESALYVSCGASIVVIDTATAMIDVTVPVAGGTPSGVAAQTDGSRVYFTRSDGALAFIDTTTDMLTDTSVTGQSWDRSFIAMTADPINTRALIAWKNGSNYSVEAYDVINEVLLFDPLDDLLLPTEPAARLVAEKSSISTLVYGGGFSNAITQFDLSGTPTILGFVPQVASGGLALLENDSQLVLSRSDSLTLEFRDTANLFTVIQSHDLSTAADEELGNTGVGASMRIGVGSDGVERLFLIKNPETGSAQLLGIPLQ